MKTFDVQSVGIEAPRQRVFDYVANPVNLPCWTNAFKAADRHAARLQTPEGVVDIKLVTDARPEAGTIDWFMTFPDGAVGAAYSRVMPDGEARSVFSFVLMAPPVPLEALEGTLEAQRAILAEELIRLKKNLEM